VDKIKDLIEKIGLSRFIAILAIAIGTLVFFTYLTLRTVEPEMGLLFAQVDPAVVHK